MDDKIKRHADLMDERYSRLAVYDFEGEDIVDNVKNVVVILSSSRAGSSLFKEVLSRHPQVISLSGEEEPYYTVTKNGFPFSSTNSDSFTEINNIDGVRSLLIRGCGTYTEEPLCISDMLEAWYDRFTLQFPRTDFWMDNFNKVFTKSYRPNLSTYMFDGDYELHTQMFLKELLGDKAGYYDMISSKMPFTEEVKVEEPPFVVPGRKRRIRDLEELKDKVLLFKTPQNCYRIGVFEKLFPKANIKYIHLTRGFAQTVNGLIDGWLDDRGFFAHDMSLIDEPLGIKGYSDVKPYGKEWWKFDLPPSWKQYKDEYLTNVVVHQWHSAHKAILESKVSAYRIKFEDFLQDKQNVLNDVLSHIGIDNFKIDKLPVVMATEKPEPYRWKKREHDILCLAKKDKVRDMMYDLGYSLEPKDWR